MQASPSLAEPGCQADALIDGHGEGRLFGGKTVQVQLIQPSEDAVGPLCLG